MRTRAILLSETEFQILSNSFKTNLPLNRETQPELSELIRDTLSSPGNLVRGQLSYMTVSSFQSSNSLALEIAVAVEYFHTASLILDDLPCMDDAVIRRGKPCAHKKHGEAFAILCAMSLINRAYALVWNAIREFPPEISTKATRILEDCLGANGVLNGQAADLAFFSGSDSDLRSVSKIALGKTATMMKLALCLPGVLVGASPKQLHLLNRLANFWGLSYQIIDDINDVLSAPLAEGKTTQRDELLSRPNMVIASSLEEAKTRLYRLTNLVDSTIVRLKSESRHWSFLRELSNYLYSRAPQEHCALTA